MPLTTERHGHRHTSRQICDEKRVFRFKPIVDTIDFTPFCCVVMAIFSFIYLSRFFPFLWLLFKCHPVAFMFYFILYCMYENTMLLLLMMMMMMIMMKYIRACFPHLCTAGYLQESCRCSAITHFHCESFKLSPLGGASTSGFVLLSRDVEFSREFYCTYVIEAPSQMRVSVRLNDIHLPMLGASCKASVLRLYDGNTTQLATRQLIGMILLELR